jgi:hypothetical protein
VLAGELTTLALMEEMWILRVEASDRTTVVRLLLRKRLSCAGGGNPDTRDRTESI